VRVAALYDIHGNLPALEAVLGEVRSAGVDRVVVGGDVVPGPMPSETLRLLLGLELPVDFLYGNGELAVLAQLVAGDSGEVTYWGTVTGEPLPEPLQDVIRWTAFTLGSSDEDALRTWPGTLEIEHPAFGRVLFCHATPWSETDGFTRLTSEESLLPVLHGLADLVVCGHTHMQFDRMIGPTRVVNAGSVGMPFGPPGADWLLLAENVELRHTAYDLARAAARVRATHYPQAEEFAAHSILTPPSEEEMARAFANVSFGNGSDSASRNLSMPLPPTAGAAIMNRRGPLVPGP
jgi:predicted phosphodiesterase